MVDPNTYRAEPDPVFAARLERLLLQRLVASSDEPRSIRRGAASDGLLDAHPHTDEQDGDLIMLDSEDRPTHRPPNPGRGSPGRWLMAAAAVAAVALVGALVVTAGDDDDEVDTADPTPTTTTPVMDWADVPDVDGSFYAPGRYFVDLDGDPATPLRATFEVTEDGWSPWPGAYKQRGGLTGFSIADIANVTTDACTDDTPREPPVGPTVDDLATALTQLPPFTVATPPTDVTIDGYHGKHLTLTTPSDLRIVGRAPDPRFADCIDGHLNSWIFRGEGGAFWGYAQVPDIREQFWILDVEGTRVVLVKVDSPSSPAEDITERDAMFDSIDIQPNG